MIDSIVLHRTRAVAAPAFYFQAEVDIVLLAGLHAQQEAFALLGLEVAGVSVDAVFSVDQLTMVLDEPLDAVGFAAFFVGGESQNQVARWTPALLSEAEEVGD